MCIETMSLGTALSPKFAFDVGYDVKLLQLISEYQKNPGTETYKAVQKYLKRKRREQQALQNTFNTTKSFNKIDLHIVDYEGNLLWSTSPLVEQDKIVLLYQASDYSNQATQGSAYKKFEDGTISETRQNKFSNKNLVKNSDFKAINTSPLVKVNKILI